MDGVDDDLKRVLVAETNLSASETTDGSNGQRSLRREVEALDAGRDALSSTPRGGWGGVTGHGNNIKTSWFNVYIAGRFRDGFKRFRRRSVFSRTEAHLPVERRASEQARTLDVSFFLIDQAVS